MYGAETTVSGHKTAIRVQVGPSRTSGDGLYAGKAATRMT